MFHQQHLFLPKDRTAPSHIRDANHLARISTLLGPPPSSLLTSSSPRALEFFNPDGSLQGQTSVSEPNDTLESVLASALERAGKTMGAEESRAFLAFLRHALTWCEDERASAGELVRDRWLKM